MTNASAGRTLSLIGAPSSAGAYGPGQEHAPAAFRDHGLLDALRAGEVDLVDRGDTTLRGWRRDERHPEAANAELVLATVREVADAVASALADDHNVLVLGGDCTVELGTVAGALRHSPSVALAYIDLDVDLNTPETGDGILDWMGVAHLLGVPGADPDLAAVAGRRPALPPEAVRLIAADNITPPERAVISALALTVEPLAAVTGDLAGVVARTDVWAKDYDRLLVHLDIDVLDYSRFPIAENTDRRGGLEMADLTALLTGLCRLPNWRALTISEINPGHAPDVADSMRHLIDMVVTALSHR